MSLFKERIPYKPFEYPIYYTEGWLKQAQAFWLHTEIPMSGDVKDWNEKLTPAEKNLVGNILLGFAQTECAVSDYWTQKVVSWFPKHEVQQMAMMFGSQETIHAVAYSYLNETLGLEDFEAFLHEPATSERFDNLVSYNGTDPVGIGRSLAVFSAFAEGVSLYSAFAVLYSFQLRNLLKGIGQQMKNYRNWVTQIKEDFSNMTKTQQRILIGSIILLGVTLTLTFLRLGRLTIVKQTKEKILKTYGKIKLK